MALRVSHSSALWQAHRYFCYFSFSHISSQLGIILAMCLMPFQERIYASVTKNGHYPEARLYPSMLGAMYVPIQLTLLSQY